MEKIRYSWKTMSAECETSETETETNFYPYTGLRKDLDFRSLNHDNILSIYESRLWWQRVRYITGPLNLIIEQKTLPHIRSPFELTHYITWELTNWSKITDITSHSRAKNIYATSKASRILVDYCLFMTTHQKYLELKGPRYNYIPHYKCLLWIKSYLQRLQ